MFAALVLDPLACLGRFTLSALDCIALLADFRLFLGDLAFLGLAYLRIAERVGAPAALFLGQRLEDDARGLRCRGWRRGRRRSRSDSRCWPARDHADAPRR